MNQPLNVVQFNPDNPKHVQLKDAVESIQTRHHRGTLSVWISIENMLKRYRLDSDYTAAEILVQCYDEGLGWIEQGGLMENPTAWLRYACYQRIKFLKQLHAGDRA